MSTTPATKSDILELVDNYSTDNTLARWQAWRHADKLHGRKFVYRAYMSSDDWKAKRLAFLNTKKGCLCEGCNTNEGYQVHHKTYDHLYDEPFFDLALLCDPCHERITAMDRAVNRSDD